MWYTARVQFDFLILIFNFFYIRPRVRFQIAAACFEIFCKILMWRIRGGDKCIMCNRQLEVECTSLMSGLPTGGVLQVLGSRSRSYGNKLRNSISHFGYTSIKTSYSQDNSNGSRNWISNKRSTYHFNIIFIAIKIWQSFLKFWIIDRNDFYSKWKLLLGKQLSFFSLIAFSFKVFSFSAFPFTIIFFTKFTAWRA